MKIKGHVGLGRRVRPGIEQKGQVRGAGSRVQVHRLAGRGPVRFGSGGWPEPGAGPGHRVGRSSQVRSKGQVWGSDQRVGLGFELGLVLMMQEGQGEGGVWPGWVRGSGLGVG